MGGFHISEFGPLNYPSFVGITPCVLLILYFSFFYCVLVTLFKIIFIWFLHWV